MATLIAALERVAGSAAFAYPSLLALQAKALWGIWEYRDLSAGDSSSHFTRALQWQHDLQVDPLFSPLYTALWGSLRWLVSDVYASTTVHRVLIVLAVSLLVLALFRKLLSPVVAWLLAVWWALLPVVYDTSTELHVFALVPVLVAALVALSWSGPGMRATVFGILLAGAVLVRNELAVAAVAWALICIAYEFRARRRADGSSLTRPLPVAVAPFLVAIGATVIVAGLAVLRTPDSPSLGTLADRAGYKQDFAFCQHYAVGYEQRHPGPVSRGWSQCELFMQRDFGSETPSFTEALHANTGAIADHLGWNLELAPYGLELALFDRTSGPADRSPDYVPVTTGTGWVLFASLLVLALALYGLALLWRERRRWWKLWVRVRAWGWAVLGAGAAMGVWVALTTHPRPAYLYALTVALLAVLGLCAMAIADRWPSLARARPAIPLVALALLIGVPSHYDTEYATPQLGPGRHLAEMVSRLQPYRAELDGAGTVLLAEHAFDGCRYVGELDPCTAAAEPLSTVPPGPGGAALLDRRQVDFVYADERALEDPGQSALLAELSARGWRRLAPAQGEDWLLLGRRTGL